MPHRFVSDQFEKEIFSSEVPFNQKTWACAKLKQTKIKTKNNHLTSAIWLTLSLFYKALKEGLKDPLPQGQRTEAGELLY